MAGTAGIDEPRHSSGESERLKSACICYRERSVGVAAGSAIDASVPQARRWLQAFIAPTDQAEGVGYPDFRSRPPIVTSSVPPQRPLSPGGGEAVRSCLNLLI